MIIDDEDGQNSDSIWNIWYHMYLDKNDLDFIQRQALKLYELSTEISTWTQSKYGSCLRFCDTATLKDVRRLWDFYSCRGENPELSTLNLRHHEMIKRGQEIRTRFGDECVQLTAYRSANPAAFNNLQDLAEFNAHYWASGSLELDPSLLSKLNEPNPTLLTLHDEATLHYGTDPLLGFHLALAYVPLTPSNPPFSGFDHLPRKKKVVAFARMELKVWASSFRQNQDRVKIRFMVGEALAFVHTLNHKSVSGSNTANWYRHPYCAESLVLDDPEYANEVAPLSFDVIDTSNLADHVGALVLLAAVSPLLNPHISSALYTESMVKEHKNYTEALTDMLCGHIPTMSTMLGLFPVEYWLNTSSYCPGDEDLINRVRRKTEQSAVPTLQMFSRIC
jgi:hypothetical protein